MKKINISQWHEFIVGDVFPNIIKPTVVHAKSVIQSQEGIPYVVRSKFNNGIKCRVALKKDYKPSPAGTISFGAENASFFYQSEQFISGRDIYYIDTRHLSKQTCIFVAACLQSITHKYSYNNGLFPDLLRKEHIFLPATSDGQPDWAYMEDFIKDIEAKVNNYLNLLDNSIVIGGNRGRQCIEYQYDKQFRVGDLFKIFNGKGITKNEISQHPGSLPAIQSGEENNGCIGYINEAYCQEQNYTISNGACLTVARSGSSGFVAYHPTRCVVGDSAKILEPIAPQGKYTMLFLKAILMVNKRKYAYNDKVTTQGYLKDTITLPATPEGNPDWEYMEAYMRQLESRQILSCLQHFQQRN